MSVFIIYARALTLRDGKRVCGQRDFVKTGLSPLFCFACILGADAVEMSRDVFLRIINDNDTELLRKWIEDDPKHFTAVAATELMVRACYLGAEEVVNILLANSVNPDQSGPDGMTPLMAAAKGGHIKVVTRLIYSGAQVNLVDEHGLSALHWCSTESDNVGIASYLASMKAELDCRSSHGFSPLDYAKILKRPLTASLLQRISNAG